MHAYAVICRCLLLAAAIAASEAVGATAFRDPLDTPAHKMARPASSPINAMARAGDRLVGVGMRGVILVSSDEGVNWRQVPSPVQSDLTGVHFPTPTKGWIVGHDGVILHSTDGGQTWALQFDGRRAAREFPAEYEKLASEGKISQRDANAVAMNYQAGPSLPYLDVWFKDELQGWAVGSFGTIAATHDGGKTWHPWTHHVDNPDYFNLNAIRAAGDDIFISGEQGRVYRLDRTAQRFVAVTTGYKGSFFGIGGTRETLLAFGLGGNVYRSTNRGETWNAVPSVMPATVTGAVFVNEREVLLTNVAGMVLRSEDGGRTFRPHSTAPGPLLNGALLSGPQNLVTFGLNGIQSMAIPATQR